MNIVAIEDPVEKHIRGISQMQVNTQAGLTFETGLRAALRQDPDVIMVGETRDSQTLKTSVRAAVTGHLVLSTLHTNNAAGTVVRMLDMGAEPYLAASSLSGILAQRLVRKIWPDCKTEREPDEEEGSFWDRGSAGSGTEPAAPAAVIRDTRGGPLSMRYWRWDKTIRAMIAGGAGRRRSPPMQKISWE